MRLSVKVMRISRPAGEAGPAAKGSVGWAFGPTCCVLMLFAAGCTPAQYARQADGAAYGLVKEKQVLALGEGRAFDITYRPFRAGEAKDLPQEILLRGKPIPVGEESPRTLSLDECLEIAVRNGRRFQTRKEQLYTQALELASLRHDWSLVSGNLSSDASYRRNEEGITIWDGSGQANLSFAQRFATGGVATLAAGLDFATDFLGIKSTTFGSFLEANLTQPLWRGAWRGFAYEGLYRAERDLALGVLDYDRFTQTLAVDTAAAYYRVLQQGDELENETENLKRLEQTAKLVKAKADAGIVSPVEADLAGQDVLVAQARIEVARQGFQNAMDEFKLGLGLPIAASVELDKQELERLEPLPFPFEVGKAIEVAFRARPDVLTRYAALRDAGRDVEIAADAFNPQLDLALGISALGRPPRRPFEVQFHRRVQTAELSFDYSLDQTDNRDNFRRTVIAHERARRELEEFMDNVRLEVRRSYRALVQSKNTYEIQKTSVAQATRRVKLVMLEQKVGRAATRDVLEAEESLRSSKIARTGALVDYVTTRLKFLATLGMISVDEQGRFHERKQPSYLDRYRGDAP
ncbi:MAG: hypothetical protein AMJ81_03870 [Phycisphaerae bacterium SM23_33]|nr:MAG: hypothetical protein AMJ81_03870 [Phycisphaerae bacterium SM23_33]